MAFDLLHLDGATLTGETYARRREELERLKIRDEHWLTTPCAYGAAAAAALWEHTRAHSWEGVVAKRLSSPYSAAVRTRDWLKAKHPHARDLQVDRSTWTTRERQRARTRA
jgi:bifunctional non-homologous end joining protein LigD